MKNMHVYAVSPKAFDPKDQNRIEATGLIMLGPAHSDDSADGFMLGYCKAKNTVFRSASDAEMLNLPIIGRF